VSSYQQAMNKMELNNMHIETEIDRISSPFVFKVVTTFNSTFVYILINDNHIKDIFSKNLSAEFIFYKKRTLDIKYWVRSEEYSFNFDYIKHDLHELDQHLNRLRPLRHIPALNSTFKEIEEFKNSFNVIELPNKKINYHDLLAFFNSKYPRFTARDFN